MAQQTTMGSVRLEMLNKENFDSWKIHAQAMLIRNDMWEYVSGTLGKPELPAEPTPAQTTAFNQWMKQDLKARSDIILAISASELRHIRGCETSKEVWDKIEEIYAPKGPAQMATLLKQLLQKKMSEGCDVREHMAQFFETVDKLAAMEVDINEKLLTLMLLQSLPSSYEIFRRAIESRDKLPDIETLKNKIIEANQSINEESEQNQHGALFVKQQNSKYKQEQTRFKEDKNGSPGGNKPRAKYKCNFCRKLGHKAADCYMKKKKEQTNNAEESFLAHDVDLQLCDQANYVKASSSKWCLDSGCTSHLCNDKKLFTDLTDASSGLKLADGTDTEVAAKGDVRIIATVNGSNKAIKLENTLLVPELKTNLISVAKIVNTGNEVIFTKDRAIVRDQKGRTKVVADRDGDLFYLRTQESYALSTTVNERSDLDVWHERLGHVNKKDLLTMSRDNMAVGLNIKAKSINIPCEICTAGKLFSFPFHARQGRSSTILELVHTDVCGRMRTESMGGAGYFVTFIDDFSGWCEVYFIRHKNEVLDKFKQFKTMAENQTGHKIKSLQSDNGGEYCNSSFDKFLTEAGIRRRLTVAHTPQQNGVAERRNRTLVEATRCMLLQSGLPPTFWAEGIATANYIRNRCISSTLGDKTPFELWTGTKPIVSHVRTFGCKAYLLNKSPKRGKFDPKAKKGTMIGYSSTAKAYRIWVPAERKIYVSRDVKFFDEFEPNGEHEDFYDEATKSEQSPPTNPVKQFQTYERNNELTAEVTDTTEPEVLTPEVQSKRGRGRPRKVVRTVKRGRPRKQVVNQSDTNKRTSNADPGETREIAEAETASLVSEIPFDQAINGPNSHDWKDAIYSEMKSLISNNTWDLVPRPDDRVINCRTVLRNKFNADGSLDRRKARVVAQGFSQRPGIDFKETFAPVARLNSLRILAAISAENSMKIAQFDIATAYLNGIMDTTVYMEQPKMIEDMLDRMIVEEGSNELGRKAQEMLRLIRKGNHVCKLNKSIYGLKQSGRQWHAKLDDTLRSMGFKPANADPCVYYNKEKDIIVLVYVDDLLVAYKNTQKLRAFKEKLCKEFSVRDLGEAKFCLGIEITQTEGENGKEIRLSQTGYIRDILERFNMADCKPVGTPLALGNKFTDESTMEDDEEKVPYRDLIGALMYLAIGTRPDIIHTVSYLSQFNTNFNRSHWIAAKRVLRYLKGTPNHSLNFKKTEESLKGFVDSDWGGCVIDRRSYSGYLYVLSGGTVSWESRKQRSVALSSTEAEYMALSDAVKESIYLIKFLTELGFQKLIPVQLHNDNQGAEKLAKNPVFHSKSKHIDIRYHFIRTSLNEQPINLQYLNSERMPADALTKALPTPKFQFCVEAMGLYVPPDNK